MHEPAQKIVSDDGEFHVEDDEVDLSPVTAEGWISLGFFWLLGATVFYQFIRNHTLDDFLISD